MYSVLIVEDERLVQELFLSYIKSASDRYELAEVTTDAANTEMICKSKKVDLILMDVCTANNSSGLEAARCIKSKFPMTKIIIVTSAPEYTFIDKAKAAKIDSFWYKDLSEQNLLNVMDRTMAGESVYPEKTPEIMIGLASSYELTPKELKVLSYLAEGLSTKEVADRMGISNDGVNEHIKHLKSKTGCTSRTQLAVLASKKKLVLPEF